MLLLFFGTDEFSVRRRRRPQGDADGAHAVRPDVAEHLGHRHAVDQLLQRQHGDHDALFVDAGASPPSRELYVDPSTLEARVQWSKGAVCAQRATSSSIPAALQVGGTYLIYSEVKLQLRARRRLGHEQGRRHHAERLHLHPSAPVDLRDVQHDGLHHDVSAATPNAMPGNAKKKAAPWARPFAYSNGNSPGARPRPGKSLYPAARRLSAEDLPERRSATIS